jgi:hypothetical protein
MRNLMIGVVMSFLALSSAEAFAGEPGSETMDDVYMSLTRFNDSLQGRQLTVDSAADARAAHALGFVWGVFDGLKASLAYQNIDTKCTSGVNSAILIHALIARIDANPSSRTSEAWYAVPGMITAIYPCLNPPKAK